MKAVVYHADSHFAWGDPVTGVYEPLFREFVKMCHRYDMQVVHLTLKGFPGWGDENRFFGSYDPKNVMANREVCFTEFLRRAPEDVYWFTEPDYRIARMWPPLEADCAMLFRRGDAVPMTPSWRLATPQALPFFLELRDRVLNSGYPLDWHCDSAGATSLWKDMGRPETGYIVEYQGVEISFRDYSDYIKGKCTYGRNYLSKNKLQLLEAERGLG